MSSVQVAGGRRPTGLSGSFGSPSLDAGAVLQESERLRQAGDLARAQPLCEQLLARYPDFVSALQVHALILSERGQHQAALLPAIRAVMLNPRDWYSSWFLGTLYLKLGANEMAIRSLRQSLEFKPDEPSTLVTLGNIYNDERNYDLAVAAFRRALEIDPSFNEARSGLSIARCISATCQAPWRRSKRRSKRGHLLRSYALCVEPATFLAA